MKRTLAVIAIAAMGLAACQNNFEEAGNADVKNNITVKFVAESAESRTAVDTVGETPLFSWNENETFAVLEQTDDALAQATAVTYEKVDCKAVINAEFAANEGKAEYSYVAVYPESGYVAAENINAATLALPATQTMVEGSYDPNADLMVSMPIATTAQPTEAQSLRFTRLAAVAKMSIKNLSLESGEVVERVEFTAEGKALAGNITADLTNPHEFTPGEGSSCVTVATASAGDVYFTVLPTTLEAGDAYTITVVTNKHLFVKTSAIPEGKSIVFEAGMVSRVSVNMSGVVPSEKWVLVRDASTLKQGDIVAIAAKDYDKALSVNLHSNASETSTSTRRGSADVSKCGNYLIGGNDVQKLVLVTGTVDETFCFYDDVRKKFLVSSNASSRYLINQAHCDNNTSFAITIDDQATATIKNIEGDLVDNAIQYYKTTDYFYSGTSANQAVCIYKLEGGVGVIPVVAANVTVPGYDEKVEIAAEGVQSATAIADVVFNYVGDWTISVSDDAEWIDFAYDQVNNCITYTAQANTGTIREAEVTITASMEGQESLSWSFNILQKSAPKEITIAEFITKDPDENITYKLTGIIATIPNTDNGNFELVDEAGNKAIIKYLKLDNGGYVNGNVDLKVGDVVTVTTVVVATKGSGGNGSYPSIYKGHYRLTATAETTPIGYEGGIATITVTKEGNLFPAGEVVRGRMSESYDFVTFDYTNDAATATVAFAENSGSIRYAQFDFTYGLASASVSIEQQNNPSLKVGWYLVTDVNELAAGDKVIIAAKDSDCALAVGSSTTNTVALPSASVSKSGNKLINIGEIVSQFTLTNGLKEGEFAFNLCRDDVEYYLCAPSASEQLKIKKGDLVYYGSWTIAIDANTGEATIDTVYGVTTATPKRMIYDSTSMTFITCKFENASTAPKAPICLYKYYN